MAAIAWNGLSLVIAGVGWWLGARLHSVFCMGRYGCVLCADCNVHCVDCRVQPVGVCRVHAVVFCRL